MADALAETTRLSPRDAANLLAGKAVAGAEAYLFGHSDRGGLGRAADALMLEVFNAEDDRPSVLLDQVRILTIVMLRTARSEGERNARWRSSVLAAFAELVRNESLGLRHDVRPMP